MSIYSQKLCLYGQGPVFAILGAWFICQLLNQDALSKDNSQSMIQKAIIATALGCILSNFGPIDDWLVTFYKIFFNLYYAVFNDYNHYY